MVYGLGKFNNMNAIKMKSSGLWRMGISLYLSKKNEILHIKINGKNKYKIKEVIVFIRHYSFFFIIYYSS